MDGFIKEIKKILKKHLMQMTLKRESFNKKEFEEKEKT